MKNFILLPLLLLSAFYTIAQRSTIDYHDSIPMGKVTYMQITKNPLAKHKNGETILLFNRTKSLYIHTSYPKGYTSYQSELGIDVHDNGDPEGFPIYKMHIEKQIYYKTHTTIDKKKVVVRDTLGKIDWKILPEYKTLGRFKCQKAIGDFRGRTYEVWFSSEIPIPSGPHKLGGLPGLILEAQTLDGYVQFLFVNMEFSDTLNQYIVPPRGKYLKMNYEELHRAEDEFDAQYERERKARGVEITVSRDPGAIEIGN